MSDAAIASGVSGLITITAMIVGLLTLWLKLKYKVDGVEGKLDVNTTLTHTAKDAATAAASKAENAATMTAKGDAENLEILHRISEHTYTIEEQTNGVMTELKNLIVSLSERVAKLEEYNRSGVHRLNDAIQAMHLKVAELVALQPRPAVITVEKLVKHQDEEIGGTT